MGKRKKPTPLTEAEWRRVLELRILSKQGRPATDDASRKLINRAFNEDQERYAAMEADVFDAAAASIGSTVRWRR